MKYNVGTIIFKRFRLLDMSAWNIWCVLRHVWLYATPWTVAYQAPLFIRFPSKNTRMGCHFLLQKHLVNWNKNSTWNWRFFQCFRALKLFFFPLQHCIFANTESKLFRKNKEYTSNIRITTQQTSSATVCGRAFDVCFPVRIYWMLFWLHVDKCRTMITANLPLISHGYFGAS